MALVALGSVGAVNGLILENKNVVVVFSAHWCGPCNRSKPDLESLAAKYTADVNLDVKFGICYENDLGDDIHSTFSVRAFPTYVLFQQQKETNRVEGANLQALEQMILDGNCTATPVGGETLGGGSGAASLSPAEARAARLAKLSSPTSTNNSTNEKKDNDDKGDQKKPAAASTNDATTSDTTAKVDDVEMKDAAAGGAAAASDVEMKDATTAAQEDTKMDTESVVACTPCDDDPLAKLDAEHLKTLTESMGFTLLRAQKGLLFGNGGNVEGAVDWLMQHQDDDDIDEPIDASKLGKALGSSAGGAVAQSYKCNECGKILSNMANLELHANKTGHSDFEESTEHVKPLTAEEKAAKIAEIKNLLKEKRAAREQAEKQDDKEREKQRRFMGKEMAKTKEQMEMEQRKRTAELRKKEKEAFKKERARLRAELAKDKAERASNKGKLGSKLGVEGYHPDGIQYDVEQQQQPNGDSSSPASALHAHKKLKADASRIDEYIEKVSSYKAGGDGGKCLKVLKAYVGNLVDKPGEDKFKTINTENKAYKSKVKPFVGAKNLLLAVGFAPNDDGNALVLNPDRTDATLLAQTKEKLEKALEAYG